MRGGPPPAAALKLTEVPSQAVWLVGERVSVGGISETVRKASELVTAPKALVMTTVYGPAWESWTLVSWRVGLGPPATGLVALKNHR